MTKTNTVTLIAGITLAVAGTIVFGLTKIAPIVSFREVGSFFLMLFVALFVTFAWIVKRKLSLGRAALIALLVAGLTAACMGISSLLARL